MLECRGKYIRVVLSSMLPPYSLVAELLSTSGGSKHQLRVSVLCGVRGTSTHQVSCMCHLLPNRILKATWWAGRRQLAGLAWTQMHVQRPGRVKSFPAVWAPNQLWPAVRESRLPCQIDIGLSAERKVKLQSLGLWRVYLHEGSRTVLGEGWPNPSEELQSGCHIESFRVGVCPLKLQSFSNSW